MLWASRYKCDVVDAEGFFQWSESVKRLKNGIWIKSSLKLNYQSQAVLPVRQIDHIMDALELLGIHGIANLVYNSLRPYKVWQFGNHKTGSARSNGLNGYLGARFDCALTLAVCLKESFSDKSHTAGREVWARQYLHYF